MKIAFLLDDAQIDSTDFTNPRLGNPGVGGTEYCFVVLPFELSLRKLAECVLIHNNPSNLFPRNIEVILATDREESAQKLIGMRDVDFLVVRGHATLQKSGILESLPTSIPVLVWTHNHLDYRAITYLARSAQVRKVVYVGREQCAWAAGTSCDSKATYIPNIFYPPTIDNSVTKERRAVYVGSITPSKGFGHLARLWPEIHKRRPDAWLDVIGSGRVYDANERLGPCGVASAVFEDRIMRYLHNDPAKYNVVFHGKLGVEKFEVMNRAIVGLPNPTGYTECCPGSVLELSACGAAIIGRRRWGYCDVVEDGTTGYLCSNDHEYVERVVSLLSCPSQAEALGNRGPEYVAEHFDSGVICAEWMTLFTELQSARDTETRLPELRGEYPLSWLRRIKRRYKSPSVCWLLSMLDKLHGWYIRNH